MTIHGYHCHIYFNADTRTSAAAFREEIIREWTKHVVVHGLIDRPIGPHPLPMFEVDVPAGIIEPVRSWLDSRRGPHSILLHPLTGDEVADHQDFPRWLGPALPLDIEFLKSLRNRP